jgi:hypothetical protein
LEKLTLKQLILLKLVNLSCHVPFLPEGIFYVKRPRDQAVDVDGETIRSRIMPKIAEKLSFLMRRGLRYVKRRRLAGKFAPL